MKKGIWRSSWKVLNELGSGGQGHAFLVENISAGANDKGVMKVLKNQSSPERRARAVQEVASLRVLSDTGVAKYIDSNVDMFKEDIELYLVTEYVAGSELDAMIRKGAPTIDQAITLLKSLIRIVAYCHSQNVVHRDIKPSNIIVKDDDFSKPVLIDFGLSFGDSRDNDFETDISQHLGNRFIYLPEYHTRGADKRNDVSDITQCVGVLFFMIFGVPPESLVDSEGKKPHERSLAAARLKSMPPNIQKQLDRIFNVGFSPEIDRRWQSTSTFLAELDGVGTPLVSSQQRFEEKLASLRLVTDGTPEMKRRRSLELLVGYVAKDLQAIQATIHKSFIGEIRLSFNQHKSDAPQGYYEAIGAIGHKHFENSKRPLVVKTKVVGAEMVIEMSCGDTPYESTACGIFDPAANDVMKKNLEDVFAKMLQDWIARLS